MRVVNLVGYTEADRLAYETRFKHAETARNKMLMYVLGEDPPKRPDELRAEQHQTYQFVQLRNLELQSASSILTESAMWRDAWVHGDLVWMGKRALTNNEDWTKQPEEMSWAMLLSQEY